jgi:hypothetical protein
MPGSPPRRCLILFGRRSARSHSPLLRCLERSNGKIQPHYLRVSQKFGQNTTSFWLTSSRWRWIACLSSSRRMASCGMHERGQFRKNGRCLALKRGAAGKVAGQRVGKGCHELIPFLARVNRARATALARKKAAASRCCIRRQFRNDRHCLALKRGAAGKVAGQFRCERFRVGECCACSGRVPRALASPVPCRARDTFRKPRAFCGD